MDLFFDEQALLQSSIFELRNIARELGVYSPTIYKKRELIKKMLEIVNGEVAPHVPKSKQGRPPKSISSSKVLDTFIPNKDVMDKNQYSLSVGDKTLVLGEHTRAFLEDTNNKPKSITEFEGYLTINDEGYGFLREPKNFGNITQSIYVSPKQISALRLRDGDKIAAVCKVLTNDTPGLFVEPININGKSVKNREIKDFNNLPVEYSVDELNIDKTLLKQPLDFVLPISLGNCVIALNNKVNKVDINMLLNALNKNSEYTCVSLSLEILKEKEIFLNQLHNIENFYTLLDQTTAQHFGMANLSLQRAKRLVENGKDVVLVIDSLDKVIKNQNLSQGNNLLEITPTSLGLAKQFMGSARKIANGGSLTVIAFVNYKPNNIFDQTIIDEFDGVVSKVVILS